MTEEIINSDGSRNWQANILLDNVKRLEQENKQMKSALEKIRILATKNVSIENFVKIQNKINEVLE